MEQRYKEKTALVTGGTSGIGRAVATLLARQGTRVVIAGRTRTRGETAAEAIAEETGGEVAYLQADVSREEDVEALIEGTANAFGGLDFVFNNAASEGLVAPVQAWPEQACDRLLQINVKGPYLVMKHVLPLMLEQEAGIIVNTSSFVGTAVALPTAVLYGATKAAVLSMTASAAAAYGPRGVRIYAICPWMTDTPMMERLTNGDPEVREQYIGINPSGEVVQPRDVAEVVLSMFSGDGRIENGGAVLVDSGGTTQRLPFPLPVEEVLEEAA